MGGGYIERDESDLQDLLDSSDAPLFLVLDGVQILTTSEPAFEPPTEQASMR